MLQQALDLHRKGQLAEAASFYREILTRTPQEADVLHLLGILEVQRKNPAAAIELIGRALALNPANAEYLVNYGIALRHAERFEEALASFDRALAIQPELMEALISRGNVLRNLGRFEDALASFDQALMLKPDFAEVIYNRGLALRDLLRFEEALVCFDRAVELRSGYVEAFHARARVLRDLMRFEKALAGFDHVLTLQPNRSEASIERGNLFREMQRFQDALTDYDRALGIQPGNADLLVNRGNVLADLGRFEDGLVSYDRALAINPRYTGALINRGNVLRDLKRFDEAAASFDRAIAIQPDYPFLAGHRLYFKMSICDWRDMQADIDSIGRSIEARQKAAMPFHIVATPLPASVQRICSEIYTEEKRPSLSYPRPDAYKHSRIRVGYFSTDFRSHAVAHVAAGLFDLHDRAKFEVTAFSLDIPARDAMRARLEKSFDRFVDVGAISDRDVVALARRLEIDIAVDLNGYTRNNRPGIFAMRAAPVQVSYLGYPGTMGAEFIDYIVADRIVIPEDQQRHYAEKIVYLPDTYQVND
ncbi:MAG TPA: tetratricopeptide repeat protein, partial [Micropepsaceae bacterium]|nr:tetratricopeptide repeat protein [Micropepsaceae bacterium]